MRPKLAAFVLITCLTLAVMASLAGPAMAAEDGGHEGESLGPETPNGAIVAIAGAAVIYGIFGYMVLNALRKRKKQLQG